MNPAKPFVFTPILGWSASRYDTFQACSRQYFYTYYARYDKDYPRQRIETLKRMTTVPLETGNIVHDVIEVVLQRLLKTEAAIDVEKFYDYTGRKVAEYCRKKVFAEIHYHELSRVPLDDILERVRSCLDSLLSSERFEWLTEKAVQGKEDWLIEPGGYGETRIDGMKAYCKVDFLFPLGDKIFILDWKTGKPNEVRHRKQLLGYTSWASFHLSKGASDIIPIIAYLQPTYFEQALVFNEFDVQEFAVQVRKETEEMYAYCKDIKQNIPRDKEEFMMTTNGMICGFCNFRELCGRD